MPSNRSTDPTVDVSAQSTPSLPPLTGLSEQSSAAATQQGRGTRRVVLPVWFQLLLGNRKAVVGMIVFAIIVLAALLAPVLTPYDPSAMVDLPSQSPSSAHWFGTTHQGQDVFAQIVWGGRVSLFIGASAALLATVTSAVLGVTAAYLGGWVDDILTLVTNVFLLIPGTPLLIVLSAYLPFKNTLSMILIIAFTTWAGEARVLRSQALTLRNRDFILAAFASGESPARIIVGEMMPNMTSRIAAGFLGSFIGAILFEAGLEFLGFGNTDTVSWGTTLFWAQNNSTLLTGEWWHFTFPGLAIALTATSLIFMNYGLDEISNPRLRQVNMARLRKLAAPPASTARQGAS